jgi:hypothetical protein
VVRHVAFFLLIACGLASAGPEGESRLGNLVRWYLHETSPEQRTKLLASMERITGGDIEKLAAAIRGCTHGRFERAPKFGEDEGGPRFSEGSTEIKPIAGAAGHFAQLELPEGYDPARAHPVAIQLGETNFDFRGLPDKTVVVRVAPKRHPQARQYKWAVEALVLSLLVRTAELVHIDPARVFLMGERQDDRDHAELALYVGLHNPDRFAGILAARGVWRGAGELALNSAHLDVLGIDSRRGDPVLRDVMEELKSVFGGHLLLKAPRDDREDAALVPHIHQWWKEGMREPPQHSLTLMNDRPRELRAFWLAMRPKGSGTYRKPLKLGPRKEPGPAKKGERRLAQPAWIQAGTAGNDENEVVVRTRNVAGFDFHVDPAMFDLNRPIRFTINGGTVETRIIDPSFASMLDDYRERRDTKLLYVAKLTFSVRE